MHAEEKSWRNLLGGAKEVQEPDVLVGIDIGTCFTKVAYTIRHKGEYGDIRQIQNWPDIFRYESEDTACISTILAYRKSKKNFDLDPLICGKLGPQQRQDKTLDVYEWFKEDFPGDLAVRTSSSNAIGNAARKTNVSPGNAASTDTTSLYRHFLVQLYTAIGMEIKPQLAEKKLPDWKDARIEFIFSVPATWNRVDETLQRISTKLVEVAKKAGFEGEDKHRVSAGLTEPEAAAAYSLAVSDRDIGEVGQNILVVDAGGGTTDLCVIEVQNAHKRELKIDSKSAPFGENLGSSHIDRMFGELAMDRLRDLSYELKAVQDWDLAQLSHAMRYDMAFQQNKQSLDADKAASSTHFAVGGPDLSKYQGSEESPLVNNGKLRFAHHELAELFDNIIDDRTITINGHRETVPGINKLIRRARDEIRHQSRTSSGDIDTILLSGGLGQSKYLKHRVEQALGEGQEANSRTPRVMTVDEPQLSVCKGLLHIRMWKLFGARKCNANYGILQQTRSRLLNPRHFIARRTNQVTRIGDRVFVNDIKWLIRKGDTIPPTPLKYVYTFEREEETIVRIVVSVDDKPQAFPNTGNLIPKVPCNFQKLTHQSASDKKQCEVEISFGVGRFDVKCWSPIGEGRDLVGEYCGEYSTAMPVMAVD